MSNQSDAEDRFDMIMDEAAELEIERELEERMRKAAEEGNEKLFDQSDCQSVISMQTTMTNMNYIPEDVDLDEVVDQILKTKNQAHLAELEQRQKQILQDFKQEQEEEMTKIITEERKQDLEELKQLNRIDVEINMPQTDEEETKKIEQTDEQEL